MNLNSLITKDYRKKDDFAVPKNKPKTNPIKPNFYPKNPCNLRNPWLKTPIFTKNPDNFSSQFLLFPVFPANAASFVGNFEFIFGTVVKISDEAMS